MKRIIRILAVTVLAMVLLAACQPREVERPPDQVTVKLKWVHQAQFAGMYAAVEKGFYQAQNLKVNLIPFSIEEPTIDAVVGGEADFGITGANEIIEARAQGLPVIAFAVIYKTNPLCAYSLKESGITQPQDFIGKTVGLEPGDPKLSYPIMINKLGIDRSKINEIQIGYDATELIEGKTDVSTGYVINEPHQAIEAGYEVNTILFANYGVNTYADVLFATEYTLNSNPELVERFLSATLEGWQYAIQNEEQAVDIVLKYATDRTMSHEAYMLRQSIPLIHTGRSPIGWMEKERWAYTHDILLEAGVIEKEIDIDEAFTMLFLQEIYGEID